MADMDTFFLNDCRGYGTNVDLGHVLRGVLTIVRKHQASLISPRHPPLYTPRLPSISPPAGPPLVTILGDGCSNR